MSFIKRLGFYLIGFSVGMVFLAFFFKEKRAEFCYLPNCRVLKELRSKPLEINHSAVELTIEEIKHLLTNAEVLFAQSNVKNKPCKIYVVKTQNNDEVQYLLTFHSCSEKVIVTASERIKS